MQEIPIPRIEASAADELEEHFLIPESPVVIRGWATSWPAREVWERDYLNEKVGNLTMPAIESSSGKFPDFSPAVEMRPIRVELTQYLDAIWAGSEWAQTRLINGDAAAILLSGGQLHERFGALFGDIAVPSWIERRALHYIGLWLSGQGIVSWLHYDNNGMHNLNVQVRGRKRVRLYPPAQSQYLYPHLFTKQGPGASQFSQVDIEKPDLERFPLYREATAMVAVLEEGDAVFFPAYWYHSFTHLERININVNFWWRPARYLLNAVTVRRRFWSALARAVLPGEARPSAMDISAALAALPPETRAMLEALEERLLEPAGAASRQRRNPASGEDDTSG